MKNSKINLFSLLLFISLTLIISITAFFLGRATKENEIENQAIEISSQIIVDRITDQYFTVTKTVYTNQDIEISIEDESDWSDIFWKDVLTSSALIRSDIGVDMTMLTVGDISIDEESKIITLEIPKAEIFDTSIEGDISLKSEQGLITAIEQLFEDESDDYNLVTETLILATEAAILADEQLLEEARSSSVSIIENILGELGYQVVVK